MKILLTGASGFLGNIIRTELARQLHTVITIGRSGADIPYDFSSILSDIPRTDLVVHCAGKAHVAPVSARQADQFYEFNVAGTKRLLESLVLSGLPAGFVYISSVSVYGLESGTLIKETQPLCAEDPYGASKIQAEQLVMRWCEENHVTCTILRIPLVAGPHPPGNLGKMISSIKKGYYFNIGEGIARKSMVLATDIAGIIPVAASVGGIYNLSDGYHPTVGELSRVIAKQYGKQKVRSVPVSIIRIAALLGDLLGTKSPFNSRTLKKLTSHLTFDDTKARTTLGWKPVPVLEGFTRFPL